MHEHRAPWFHGQFSPEAMLSTCHPDHEWWWKFVARCRSWCKPVESVIEFCPPVHPLFCSLAVLNPRVGHTMDVLSPFISVLCHSDWLFHGQSCPRFDVVHPGRAWSSSPACTWHCSLHYLFLQATPLFPHASFLALTVSNSSLFTPALLRTHSFVFFAVHKTRRIFRSLFISKASRRQRRHDVFLHSFWESSFYSHTLLQATLALLSVGSLASFSETLEKTVL